MHEALTEVEKVHFHELVDLLTGAYRNAEPALMRASLHGQDVAVIVAVQGDGDAIRTDPVAVLVDANVFRQLVPPDGAEVVSAAD